jgi:hypothetical protein
LAIEISGPCPYGGRIYLRRTMNRKVIDEVERDILKQQDLLVILLLLPDLEGINTIHPYAPGQVIIDMPYDLQKFQVIRETLEAVGFTWDNDLSVSPHCGEILTDFTLRDIKLSFQIDPGLPGSTCKKRIIDYEKKPIYEIVCDSQRDTTF